MKGDVLTKIEDAGLSRNAIRFLWECSKKDGGSFCRYCTTDLYSTRSSSLGTISRTSIDCFPLIVIRLGRGEGFPLYRKVIFLPGIDPSFRLIVRRFLNRGWDDYSHREMYFSLRTKSIVYPGNRRFPFEWRATSSGKPFGVVIWI